MTLNLHNFIKNDFNQFQNSLHTKISLPRQFSPHYISSKNKERASAHFLEKRSVMNDDDVD